MDLATRAYNQSFRLDPIIRSLLDTDIYKLMMVAIARAHHPRTRVRFEVICRTGDARLERDIDANDLRAQLDHARTVGLERREHIWLAGNTFYGESRLFDEDTLAWLKQYRLPEYALRLDAEGLHLAFEGPYEDVTLWEIPALAIISELRARSALRHLGRMALDVLYARAKARVWEKIERLAAIPDLKIADFGTRRRHSFLWQRWCIGAMREGLGDARFTGTSNLLHAMQQGVEAVGTNGHELPMVEAASAEDDAALAASPYRVLEHWEARYRGNIRILLPDTYGTTAFLAAAPARYARWTGARIDSKDPVEGANEMIAWWRRHGEDPKTKLVILSDGLDIGTIERAHHALQGKVRVAFGWGTNLTNDFAGCATEPLAALEPISIVCKVTAVDGRPAVKLSDNPAKATGPSEAIARYRRVFGEAGAERRATRV